MPGHWEEVLKQAVYGGVPIDILSIQEEGGRDLAIYAYPNVDGADVKDRGAKLRIYHVRILFFQLVGDRTASEYYDRFLDFKALKDSGKAHRFMHPLDGEMDARIGDWTVSENPDQRDAIYVECTFLEDKASEHAFAAGPGAPVTSIEEPVDIAADNVDSQISDLQAKDPTVPSTTVGTDAKAAVRTWKTKPSPTVSLEAASLTRKISSAIESYEAATNIKRYPLYRSFIGLHSAITKAAGTVQQAAPRLMKATVRTPMALRALLAQIYGAKEANAREPEARRLNKIRNPARVEPGEITVPSPNTPSRVRRTI